MDAITLSTGQFMEQGEIETDLGWRLILTAALSNLVLKGVAAVALGHPRLRSWVVVPFGLALLGGLGLLFFWPAS